MDSLTSPSVALRPVLTVSEVAELLGTSERTVGAMVNDGTLPSVRLGSQGPKSPIRIPRRSFERWLEGESS